MIPHQNVRNLMLNDEVAAAVRDGRFHLWAVRTIDEGLEILMGIPAGEADAEGAFPEGTINYLVNRRLRDLSERLRRFGPGRAERDGQGRDEAADKEPDKEPQPAPAEDPAPTDPAPTEPAPPADEPKDDG
jgi:hypothetical protein